jgi:hypothetical protein
MPLERLTISLMKIKLFGFVVMVFASYLIYVKRDLHDDSLLLGSGLILTGLLIIVVGWTMQLDSKRK